ncbi:transglutaminase domain-containing protein [Candidatus Pacearchaeota archaeon]|nr:transglutaminase domain-containing protein [Candidatus Pacearchaeota archaeon]
MEHKAKNNNSHLWKSIIVFYLKLLILFFIILLFFTILYFVPVFYDWIYGKEIVVEHIKEIKGNETDALTTALLFMNWTNKNVHYPQLNEVKFHLGGGMGLYRFDNKTKFFFRGGPASWTIITKMGRCGEDARYFVEVMNKSGFNARMVKPETKEWDHAWAEFYTIDGYKIAVDPSSNQVIYDKFKWAADKNLTKLYAEDLNGKREDVTKEYI